MDCTAVSDLEEGEIFENDLGSPSYSKGVFGISKCTLEPSTKENGFELKENQNFFLSGHRKYGYIKRRLKGKLKYKEHQKHNKSDISIADLESISSEEEYISDENDKYPGVNEYYTYSNGEMKKRDKQPTHFYGTVEDIMSEIGETICRKSRCNFKKRKSKDLKQHLDKCLQSTYDLWRRQIFYSHVKSKKHKRKETFVDSDSEKYKTEKRKKRKKRENHYEEDETPAKKLKSRDFDEMRRNLLEKLKKQKAEEKLKESTNEPPLVIDNSEIQEIDMLIDCTNYVDNPHGAVPEDSTNDSGRPEEKEGEGEDELDLIKLRLIALASNKKRKDEDGMPKSEETEKKDSCAKEETDLDTNELLLRAEALKTAVLKKHQRRLNRLKVEKTTKATDSGEESLAHPAEESAKEESSEKTVESFDADACKENLEKEIKAEVPPPSASLGSKVNGTAIIPNGSSKKAQSRGKTKRKKRKSITFANNLKENTEISDALEEDDRTLRTQLLSDLMKKKSQKDSEKKSVLTDFVQAVNKPSRSTVNAESSKGTPKPLLVAKPNLLKKINFPQTAKPVPTFPKPEIQRIIVHLGSEDSSDEEGSPQPAPQESKRRKEEVRNDESAILKSSDVRTGIQANLERSVELLLSQARKKIEGEKRTAPTSLATPEAVYKHLPPSQRLEYMRLKQKIAERERLRKQKQEIQGNSPSGPQPLEVSAAKETVPTVPPKPAKPVRVPPVPPNSSSDGKSSGSEIVRIPPSKSVGPNESKPKETAQRLAINKTRSSSSGKSLVKVATAPANGFKVATERNVLLLPSSQALISKLKLLLKKIKLEKTIEENYEKEISKLKNQLGLFEKRKCEQRFKIKKLWEESMKTYKTIQGITAKAAPKEKKEEKPEGDAKPKEERVPSEEKKTEGKEEKKKKEEAEVEGKKMSDEPETEISKAQSESDKELIDKISEETTAVKETATFPCLKYDSPLQVFSKVADKVDPNVMVCQFDLMGVCKDEECGYQHLRILAK